MSGSSNPILHVAKGSRARIFVQVCRWQAANKILFCIKDQVSPHLGRSQLCPLFLAKLLHWGHNDSSKETAIKMLERWKSSMYQLYIKTLQEQLASISRMMIEDVGGHDE